MKIEDLQTDLKNGLSLVHLLEVISSKSLGKFNTKPSSRYHFLENNGIAVRFIKDEGLQLVGIGPEGKSFIASPLRLCFLFCLQKC